MKWAASHTRLPSYRLKTGTPSALNGMNGGSVKAGEVAVKSLKDLIKATLEPFDIGVTRYSALIRLWRNEQAVDAMELLRELPGEHAGRVLEYFQKAGRQHQSPLFILSNLDLAVTRYSALARLRRHESAGDDLALLLNLPSEHAQQLVKYLPKSKSQFRQDLFVLSQLKFKTGGFFVEFGATNGVDLSNTHLMEKEFGWSGILAEPARCWHEKLVLNRSAAIDTSCVWKVSDVTLPFNEACNPDLSTIDAFSDADSHKAARKGGRTYGVTTISLNDLLCDYGAPQRIDYLSMDTEGSEYEILSNFDFSKHSFGVITCEHNYTPMRDAIFDLLSRNGYARVFPQLSKYDDWYVNTVEVDGSACDVETTGSRPTRQSGTTPVAVRS